MNAIQLICADLENRLNEVAVIGTEWKVIPADLEAETAEREIIAVLYPAGPFASANARLFRKALSRRVVTINLLTDTCVEIYNRARYTA